MTVLGIDPGSAITGYGIVKSARSSDYECVTFGCIRIELKSAFHLRLKKIYDQVSGLIENFQPDSVALEDIFYSRNVKAAMQLGQARAAAVLAALNANKTVVAYAPREVKQALTGMGAASKEQVQKMVGRLLGLEKLSAPLDASDALAIAICHTNRFWTDSNLRQQV
jgi:crossover junction endodeoxyribonuclease RuvC